MKITSPDNKPKKRNKAVVFSIVLIVAVICSFAFTREVKERDLFFPSKQPDVPDGRDSNGIYKKNIEMKLSSGVTLRGWLLQPEKSGDYLIYYYGNGDSVYNSGGRMAAIAYLFNINVVCFDYRGYAYSEGSPSFDNLLADSMEIYDNLAVNYFRKNSKIFTYGQSLGTIPALNTAIHKRVDGCILEAAFTDADRAIFEMGWNNIPFPINLFVRLHPEPALSRRRPQQIDQVRLLKAPVLFVHCVTDNFFPLYMGKEMMKAAGSSEKSLTEVHNCRHNPLPISPGTEEYAGMKAFFGKTKNYIK